ncbi:MAG: UdgX family uracil-DNA binding protein [Candidatus Rokubacteria bacterium]|nr:UdgX family uracil-DNA binding protein [Candidatus Rokubacteria bacterium]
MATRVAEFDPTFEGWQAAARALLGENVAPADVEWREAAGTPPAPATKYFRVPRQFLEVARQAAAANSAARWPTLYEVLWRIVHERRELLDDRADATVRRLHGLAAQARRDAEQRERSEVLQLEAQGGGAAAFVPAGADLPALADAATRCEGCPLYRDATQSVFGRGPRDARVVLVGEQPGDQEDLRGAPFVGPAGEILDRALAEAALDRERIYVTNAVKHFKFVMRGKRRIHQTPRLPEIVACRPWVEAELALIEPETLVCLGATAARSLLGADFRLMRDRGRVFPTRWAPRTLATFHPSAVLRGEDDAAKEGLYRMLVDDLRLAVS